MQIHVGRLALVSALLVVSSAAWSAPKDGEKFKDWTVQCDTVKKPSAKLDVKVKDGEGSGDQAAGGMAGSAGTEQAVSPPEEGQTICQIVQTLTEKATDQPVLQVAIGYLPEIKQPVAVFNLPLGIWLPPGLQLKVGEGKAGRVPVDTCDRNGCRAGVELDENMLGQMRKGNQLNATFGRPDRQPVTVPISLQGFSAGLDSLK